MHNQDDAAARRLAPTDEPARQPGRPAATDLPAPTNGPALLAFEDLLEQSSLGTEGARQLRERTPRAGRPHQELKSLLGAWALSMCSQEETTAVEEHLGTCEECADEALRLRDAVGLLPHLEEPPLDPMLRNGVLEGCLGRRPPRIPVPGWAAPYDAETARLDALLQHIGESEWHTPVRLRWFANDRPASRETTVAEVLEHLMVADTLVARALSNADGEASQAGPAELTEEYWRASPRPSAGEVRTLWRGQTHALVGRVSFADRRVAKLPVSYGDFDLPLRDAMLDRAFECWVHAEDIAVAVDYPYEPPAPRHLHQMIDLWARRLPTALAVRRRAGLVSPPSRLVAAGARERSVRLEVEGAGGGEWFIALDSPGAVGSAEHEVAHIALDSLKFCQLVAGHVSPGEAAAGQSGDREAIREVLFATASLNRM